VAAAARPGAVGNQRRASLPRATIPMNAAANSPHSSTASGTAKLALAAVLLGLVLAGFLLFCIQAGQEGISHTLRTWKITLFGGSEHSSLPIAPEQPHKRPALATPTAPRIPIQGTRPTERSVSPTGTPAKVAAALRSTLQQYTPDPTRTSTVTLTTGGAIRQSSSGSSTTLDGIPVEVSSRPSAASVAPR